MSRGGPMRYDVLTLNQHAALHQLNDTRSRAAARPRKP